MDRVISWNSPESYTLDQPRSFGLTYSSRRAFAAPIITLDVTPGTSLPAPDSITLRIVIGTDTVQHLDGSGRKEVYFHQNGTRSTNRIAFQFDGNAYRDSVYNYTALIRLKSGAASRLVTQTGKVIIARGDTMRYGAGWGPSGLQQLKVIDALGSVLITETNGSALIFKRDAANGPFLPPVGEHSRLTFASNTYVRRYRDGTRITFNSSGQMTAVLNLLDLRDSLIWSGGTLTTIKDPIGFAMSLTYVGSRLDRVTDPGGRQWTFTHNTTTSELTSISDAQDGTSVGFSYLTGSQRHLLGGTTNQIGRTTNFTYQFPRTRYEDQLPQVRLADGTDTRPTPKAVAIETYTVAALGTGQGTPVNPRAYFNPASSAHTLITPRGHISWINVDRYGAPTSVQFSWSGARYASFGRDTLGQVTYLRNFRGTTFNLQYDTMGNVTRIENNATGRVDQITYRDTMLEGTMVTVGPLDVRNNMGDAQPSYRYSGLRLKKMWLYPDSLSYDSFANARFDGRPDTIYDAGGHRTVYVYSGSGRQNTDSVATGLDTTTFIYDQHGRLSRRIGLHGDSMRWAYDIRNRILRVVNARAQDSVRYAYNNLYLTQVTDPEGQTYGFAYNGIGWDTAHTDPRGARDTYLYDANGNLGNWTNRRSQVITFSYDEADRMTGRVAAGVSTTFTHTPNDSLVTAATAASSDTLAFDGAGRLFRASTFRNATLYRLDATYNAAGQRRQLSLSSPTTSTVQWGYTKKSGLPDSIRPPSTPNWITINRTSELLTGEVNFPTSPATRIREVEGTAYPTTHLPGGKTMDFPAALDTKFGIMIQQDSIGRTIRVLKESQDSMRKYAYDVNRRLFHAERWSTTYTGPPGNCTPDPNFGTLCTLSDSTLIRQFNYTYDAVGNPLNFGDSIELGNRVRIIQTDFGTTDTLFYDNDGNVTERRAKPVLQQMFWNALSQLDSVLTYNTSTGSLVFDNAGKYDYDAWGRRVRKRVRRSGGTQDTSFVWDGDRVFAEFRAGSTLSATYTYYPGTFIPLSMTRSGSPYYYVTDEADNIAGLINGSAVAVNAYRHWPFGGPEQSVTVTNDFKFGAGWQDGETSLIYMRHRFYDPRSRRFISQDPIGLAGGINPYEYAANDPTNSSDRLGLQRCDRGPAGNECEPIDVLVPRCPEHFRSVLCPNTPTPGSNAGPGLGGPIGTLSGGNIGNGGSGRFVQVTVPPGACSAEQKQAISSFVMSLAGMTTSKALLSYLGKKSYPHLARTLLSLENAQLNIEWGKPLAGGLIVIPPAVAAKIGTLSGGGVQVHFESTWANLGYKAAKIAPFGIGGMTELVEEAIACR